MSVRIVCSTQRIRRVVGIAVLVGLIASAGIVGTAAATPLPTQEEGNRTHAPTATPSGGEAEGIATDSAQGSSDSDEEDNSGLVDSIVGRVVGSITGELGKLEEDVIGGIADLIPDSIDAVGSSMSAAGASTVSDIAVLQRTQFDHLRTASSGRV